MSICYLTFCGLKSVNKEMNSIKQATSGDKSRLKAWFRISHPRNITLRVYAQFNRIIHGFPVMKYSRISPSIYIGGQHRPHGWFQLQAEGITAIVNLRAEFDDRKKAIESDHYLHLPVRDNHAPSLEQLKRGVIFIKTQISNGGKVYIHCGVGVGRAPTMAVAYLISEGMPGDEAWQTIQRVRPFILPTQSQLDQINRFAKEVVIASV